VVARRQLLRLGVTKEEIDGRVRSGGLHLIHRGVYAVGHTAITRRGRWMAAVLASGDGAVLGHASAAGLWGIWGSGAGEAHVTVPRKTRSQRSIRRHFSVLPEDEREVVDGIPVTSAARAVLDLAGERGAGAAEAALREMEYLGIYGAVSFRSSSTAIRSTGARPHVAKRSSDCATTPAGASAATSRSASSPSSMPIASLARA
jgi:predicted transcriptional regulator of viral defense system